MTVLIHLIFIQYFSYHVIVSFFTDLFIYLFIYLFIQSVSFENNIVGSHLLNGYS